MRNGFRERACKELRMRAAGMAIAPVYFLKHYWQKRPLHVRGAFADWKDPISRDELAGLSCEETIESRLVMERGGTIPWQVTTGPQREAHLRRLPRSHWTLLVQGVDRAVPGVAALLEPFAFIPAWRVDDVMISFAPRGGTVGPHLDSYDVFLIQGQGRRRWRIDSQAPKDLRPGLDLRILRKFHAEEDWILNPGDMLYLPPNLAHYGTAMEECLTYSIGFRSPSAAQLVAAAHEKLISHRTLAALYRDPHLKSTRHAAEIPRTAVRQLRRLLEDAVQKLSKADFDELIGELLTEPKDSVPADTTKTSTASVRSRVMRGETLARSPESRMGYLCQGRDIALFVNGLRFPLLPNLAFAGPLLSNKRRLETAALVPHFKKPGFLRLVASLISTGIFRLER